METEDLEEETFGRCSISPSIERSNDTLEPLDKMNRDPLDGDSNKLGESTADPPGDSDKMLGLINTSTEPPRNSGDGMILTSELIHFGDDAPCHSKTQVAVSKRRRRRADFDARQLLPRRSKTRAYESLRKATKNYRMVGKKRVKTKRLKRGPAARDRKRYAALGRTGARSYNVRKKSNMPRHKDRKYRGKITKKDSGTSVSTMSTATCSSCKSEDSRY